MRKTIFLSLFAVLLIFAGVAAAEEPLYTANSTRNLSIRASESREAQALATLEEGERVWIYSFSPEWLYIANKNGVHGYILRQYVQNVEALDPDGTLPYGAVVHRYMAVVSADSWVYDSPAFTGETYVPITAGTKISLIAINDGWAEVPYQRHRGYVHLSKLTDLTPVAPTVDYAQGGDLLATYCSYYSTAQTELNTGRMVNIDVGCAYISLTLASGEQFSFNGVAGPYRKARGYMPAPVLIDGTSVPGYGGGTCQVSSTLYNVLLQLDKGITIVKRRAHGPGGAAYLPHGVDAAVGTESIDLVFQNSFPFPIRIDASAQDGVLYISIYKA